MTNKRSDKCNPAPRSIFRCNSSHFFEFKQGFIDSKSTNSLKLCRYGWHHHWILFSYRKSVVESALPEVELGEERTPLVRELGHLPPDALGGLLLVCGDGRAPGGALSLAGHCNGHSQGRCQMTAPGHTVLLPGFVRLNGYVATESSEGTQSELQYRWL